VPLEVVLLLFDACSNGIVHRDIKPENLLLSEPSTKGIVQLSDFGLSAFLAPGRKLTAVCGTIAYGGAIIFRPAAAVFRMMF
jgi:hypothetical protein